MANISGVLCRNRPAVIIKICARERASGSLHLINMLTSEINKRSDTNENAGRGCGGRFLQFFAAPAGRPAGIFADARSSPRKGWLQTPSSVFTKKGFVREGYIVPRDEYPPSNRARKGVPKTNSAWCSTSKRHSMPKDARRLQPEQRAPKQQPLGC